MNFIRQTVISLIALGAALFIWITYVPSSLPWLEKAGLTELLGIEPATANEGSERSAFGRGGPISVVVAEVEEGRIGDRIEAIGDGRAVRSVTLRSEVAGQVIGVIETAHGYVDAGDVVLQLDGEAESIALERARILLANAEDDATRVERLDGTGAVTEVRLREARLALRTAELAAEQAEYDLAQRTIRAPIDGWLGVIDLAVGDRVSPQDVIGTITDRSEILIDFRIPERAIGLVSPGTPIEVRALGIPDFEITGEIAAVDNVVDRASRTLRVQGRIPNRDDRLRAGMAFSVTMTFPGETLLSVDPLSVQWSSEGSFVWVVREDKAERASVIIRQRNSDSVVVETNDLAVGDRVVVEGVQNLRPGAEVSVSSVQSTGAVEASRTDRARL
ncbi:MAG: efflux RND transporter periplasmic adaptor subunit [Marivita sp.]|uniref:efflux RND transporter periplasmic adaptor subunit n=1 Tax=Marivita sp. TaxID=2003365 RepID=UPI0025BCE954|nr:efflux RND transporter periplasmic adaptor subunit [Marivita sp.]MCI5108965.1 efflux RND transporter periplasmic adaptor subunit [Marivita sp.]